MRICKTCLFPEGECGKLEARRKECNRCRGRAYYAANREKSKVNAKRWREANAEQHRESARKYARENPHKVFAAMLRRVYGISIEEFNEISDSQGGCCAICRNPPFKTFHVDHCHTTNKVRGLLCGTCNTGIGMFKDDPAIALRAAEYLARS